MFCRGNFEAVELICCPNAKLAFVLFMLIETVFLVMKPLFNKYYP